MELDFGPALSAFRQEVRAYIRENLPIDIRKKCEQERMYMTPVDAKRWHHILGVRGWACPHWPKATGGPG